MLRQFFIEASIFNCTRTVNIREKQELQVNSLLSCRLVILSEFFNSEYRTFSLIWKLNARVKTNWTFCLLTLLNPQSKLASFWLVLFTRDYDLLVQGQTKVFTISRPATIFCLSPAAPSRSEYLSRSRLARDAVPHVTSLTWDFPHPAVKSKLIPHPFCLNPVPTEISSYPASHQ